MRGGATPDDIDTQPWDVSVKAIAHYPTVLYMMADNLDWTTALGQAYVNQSGDVMDSVQRLRQEAHDAGNLASTPQQDVEVDNGDIEIWPAQGDYCYLPIYDPGLVFFGSGGVYGGPVITFGGRYPIGVWLNYDINWPGHRIYYHAWSGKRGWIVRSRPFIRLNKVYVNNNLKNVVVNRAVTSRAVNYSNLTRYDSVHRGVNFGSARAGVTADTGALVNNKIIQRNGDNEQRIDQFRGRAPSEPAGGTTASARASEPAGSPAFGGSRGSFDANKSSQRGQSSRSQAARPAPARSGGGGGSHSGGGGGGGSHAGGGGGGGGSHGGGGGHH